MTLLLYFSLWLATSFEIIVIYGLAAQLAGAAELRYAIPLEQQENILRVRWLDAASTEATLVDIESAYISSNITNYDVFMGSDYATILDHKNAESYLDWANQSWQLDQVDTLLLLFDEVGQILPGNIYGTQRGYLMQPYMNQMPGRFIYRADHKPSDMTLHQIVSSIQRETAPFLPLYHEHDFDRKEAKAAVKWISRLGAKPVSERKHYAYFVSKIIQRIADKEYRGLGGRLEQAELAFRS